nr:SGNH/GDSL hydrolase family protein [Bacilli bacterium]
HLSTINYSNYSDLYTTSTITYNGGHIGLYSYEDSEDSLIRGTTLTINNFANSGRPVLNNAFYSDSGWSLTNETKQVEANETDGWMLSNKFYDDVELRVKANKGASENIWDKHEAYNSIIIGGSYSNNQLYGYVVEIQNNHFEIAKLSGDGYKTGNVIKLIGHWGDGGTDFTTVNKNLFISISGQEITIASIDEDGRNADKNPSLYPSVTITLDDYEGGSIGYLSHKEGKHSVLIEEINFSNETTNEKVDVIKGKWVESTGSITTGKANNLALLKNTTLDNGTFSSQMTANGTADAGIVFNANNSGNSYYMLYMNSASGNQLKLTKVENDSSNELASCYVTAGYSSTANITLKVEFNNGDMKCYFGSSMLHARVDSTPLTGNRVGFISKNLGTIFSNESVSTNRNFKTVDTLIIGHSYMELWSNYKNDLSKYSDIDNIGIGGTASNDWIGHRSEVAAFAPNKLIYMIGINDVARKTSGENIINNIKYLIDNVMSDLPNTEICLLSVNRCPNFDESEYRNIISSTNALLKTYVDAHDKLHYGDLDSAFLDGEGNPDSTCFVDGLHPTAEAYSVIADAVYTAFGD